MCIHYFKVMFFFQKDWKLSEKNTEMGFTFLLSSYLYNCIYFINVFLNVLPLQYKYQISRNSEQPFYFFVLQRNIIFNRGVISFPDGNLFAISLSWNAP